MALIDGGEAALARAQQHLTTCGARTVLDPPCEAHALATDVVALHELAARRLDGNRVLTVRLAKMRESAQRTWESLGHYISTRTEENPCGDCGGWGEHDSDSCDLVAIVVALEEDFGCGEHLRGETIADEVSS